jgi:hypothetical protein
VFNQYGDLERCALRRGNVHSADAWETILKPDVARYREAGANVAFRGDAAFAQPSMYEYLEQEGIEYAIRLPANQILQAEIAHMLRRPVGRPAHYVKRFYKSFRYQAASWSRPRRVVAKVEWHPGELFPRVGFIVTNLRQASKNVVAFYNKRGMAEQYIKEWKVALKGTRLSCRSFNANAVRLQLHALAYNLGNFLRTLAIPETIAEWSLTTLREKLIKIGAKVVRHGRYVAFQMAEVAVPRKMFAAICGEDRSPTIAADGDGNMNVWTASIRENGGRFAPSWLRTRASWGLASLYGASSRAKPAARPAERPENGRIHPAAARKGRSYGECRFKCISAIASGEYGLNLILVEERILESSGASRASRVAAVAWRSLAASF